MVPSCATAGELKMMSPVAYDHLSVPSRPTPYTLPSCEPTTHRAVDGQRGRRDDRPPGRERPPDGRLAGRQHERRSPSVRRAEAEHRLGRLDRVLRQRHRPSAQPARLHRRARGVTTATRSGRRRTADSACSPCRTRRALASTCAQPSTKPGMRNSAASTKGGHQRDGDAQTSPACVLCRTSQSGTRNERRAIGAGAGRRAPGDGHGIRMAQG